MDILKQVVSRAPPGKKIAFIVAIWALETSFYQRFISPFRLYKGKILYMRNKKSLPVRGESKSFRKRKDKEDFRAGLATWWSVVVSTTLPLWGVVSYLSDMTSKQGLLAAFIGANLFWLAYYYLPYLGDRIFWHRRRKK